MPSLECCLYDPKCSLPPCPHSSHWTNNRVRGKYTFFKGTVCKWHIDLFSSYPAVQNVLTWLHWTAGEAGKCGYYSGWLESRVLINVEGKPNGTQPIASATLSMSAFVCMPMTTYPYKEPHRCTKMRDFFWLGNWARLYVDEVQWLGNGKVKVPILGWCLGSLG